jgi:hypothetical protein
MRTKTLILSAIVGALSSLSLMAQVYSLNAVGYINETIPPGFSIIANQLNTTNNMMSPLLDSQFQTGNYDGLEFYKYSNGSGYAPTLIVDSLNDPFPWDEAAATNTSLNPGEGIFVHSPYTTNLTITFVGTVLTGSLTNDYKVGFNMVSSQVPQAGRLDADLGMPEVDGDQIFIYNNATGGYEIFTGDSLNLPAPPWDTISAGTNLNPTVTVGQGFWYKAQTGNGPNVWVRNFSVN